jgi:hypothetical protein
MAKPKLALVPAAQGSKFYSVLPSDGVGDFDFARASAATRINKYGLIETVASGQSRLNYPLIDGVVNGCPSHLLEPARINLVTYSEDFSNWTASDITVTDNNAISPDGSLNASKLTLTSGTSVKRIALGSMPTSSVSRCYSFFFKTNDINSIQLLHSGDLQGYANFDLVNSVVGTSGSKTTSKIENYGNGWFRCTAIFDNTNTFASTLYLYIKDNALGAYGGSTSEVGDLFIFGAMYEEGSYPTSYIVSNSGSATTRVAETANNSGDASTFNDSEGVLMAEISALVNDSDTKRISLSDGTTSNRLSIYLSDNSVGLVQVAAGSVNINTNLTGYDATLNSKIIAKYKQNDFSLWINGYKILTDTSGNAYGDGVLDTLNFDNGYSGNDFYGNVKQIQYFDSELNDSELETLTSWTSFSEMAQGQLYTIE